MDRDRTKVLLVAGMILFLIGLLNGVIVPYFENPRMGLSAHLAGVQNALVLIAIGLMWKYLSISPSSSRWCLALSVYSMYAIWFSLFLAAVWGTSSATPIAGAGFSASSKYETIVNVFLYSGSAGIIIASAQVIIGLLRKRAGDY